MLYDLMGKGHIEGLFQGSVFVIKSNIDDFIKALDNAFSALEK